MSIVIESGLLGTFKPVFPSELLVILTNRVTKLVSRGLHEYFVN